jgi:hypothetical protein
MTTTTDRIAEVIEAATTRLIAQCYQLYGSPPLGTLVRAGPQQEGVYGIVSAITTQSIDPGRRPIARGEHAASEEEVYQDNPQLSRLLRTDLDILILGHSTGGQPLPHLPPQPPRLHTFVHLCPPEEVRAFTATLDFLRLLLADASASTDEATVSLLLIASQAHPHPYAFRLEAGKELARLLGSDLPRLNALLRRLAP